jgi:hypothetical protein
VVTALAWLPAASLLMAVPLVSTRARVVLVRWFGES